MTKEVAIFLLFFSYPLTLFHKEAFFFLSRQEAGRHALHDDYAVIVVIKQRVYKRTICNRRSSNSFNFALKVELSPWTYINLSNFSLKMSTKVAWILLAMAAFCLLCSGDAFTIGVKNTGKKRTMVTQREFLSDNQV